MSRFALLFLFASAFAFAEPQFYVCRGISGSSPFTIISNPDNGTANLLLAHSPDIGWQNGNNVHFPGATIKLKQDGSCVLSDGLSAASFSIQLPSCDFTPGTRRASATWLHRLSEKFEANDVLVECTLETSEQFGS